MRVVALTGALVVGSFWAPCPLEGQARSVPLSWRDVTAPPPAIDRGSQIHSFERSTPCRLSPSQTAALLDDAAEMYLQHEQFLRSGDPERVAETRASLIRTLARRVQDYPNEPGTDRALLDIADALERDGQPDRADRLYRRLLVDHPASPLLPIARLRLAENVAAAGDLVFSEALLEDVAESSDDLARAVALFRLASLHVERPSRARRELRAAIALCASRADGPWPLIRERASALLDGLRR